jgi:osmotically inducible protein OsmC
MTFRRSTIVWEGGLRSGKGSVKSDSGSINAMCSFGSRFENNAGSNPEELLAAAEACCYTMALCSGLEKAGCTPGRIETQAICTTDKVGEVFRITAIKLTVRGTVPNIDAAAFQRLAQDARDNCPVSLALKGSVRLELDCKLV